MKRLFPDRWLTTNSTNTHNLSGWYYRVHRAHLTHTHTLSSPTSHFIKWCLLQKNTVASTSNGNFYFFFSNVLHCFPTFSSWLSITQKAAHSFQSQTTAAITALLTEARISREQERKQLQRVFFFSFFLSFLSKLKIEALHAKFSSRLWKPKQL